MESWLVHQPTKFGVGVVGSTGFSAALGAAMLRLNFCVLEPDLEIRGVAGVIPGIKVVDYAGFVDLVTEHDHVHAWY